MYGVPGIPPGIPGRALGERGVKIVETRTGRKFTGTASDWGDFGLAVGGDLAGTNQVVEGVSGFDQSDERRLDDWDRWQRGISGASSLAGNAAGGLSTMSRFPGALPTLSRTGNTTVFGSSMTYTSRVGAAGERAAGIRAIAGKTRIESLSRKATCRYPDKLTKSIVMEVKNFPRTKLHFSYQIQDSLHFAMMTGRRFILKVSPTTRLSQPLVRAIRAGYIHLELIYPRGPIAGLVAAGLGIYEQGTMEASW